MDQVFAFLTYYRTIIGLIVVLLVMTLLLAKWWDEVKLFWKSVWYGLFKTRSLAKNLARDSGGWFLAEKNLCDDFYADIRKILRDPDMYDRASSYLGKAQERGRDNISTFMFMVIVGLVFLEALGFAYVLSGYTLPGASESLQVKGAFGIAFIISALLVFLTHSAGAEMHKRGLITKARTWWLTDNSEDRGNLIGADHRVSLENNNIDDDAPHYIQLANRLETNARVTPGTPVWTIVTVIAILFVAVGATVVRYETYQQELSAETTLGGQSTPSGEFSLDTLLNDPPPAVLAEPQIQADQQAQAEQNDARDTANLTTFAILAMLFVLIQIMGIGIGYKKGFAGKESKTARKIIGKFSSRAEYETWYERKRDSIARIAQRHLSALQRRLTERAQAEGIDQIDRAVLSGAGNRTFLLHYQRKLQDDIERRRAEEKQSGAPRAADVSAVQDSPVKLVSTTETREEMEARIRAEIEAEKAAEARKEPEETEEQMRARIRAEMSGGE